LALASSADLKSWKVHSIILQHPDTEKHAFQYVDWLFLGDDLAVVSRTAYDDGVGGAHNYHDANYMTFHKIKNFRSLLDQTIE
ncbi:MAG: exo-alpha-sialidase, partial [Candidatus Omnitrophica bacterium]|nr:exo-alpha-sialidase [Candidatus Omnitrophota bacterium]